MSDTRLLIVISIIVVYVNIALSHPPKCGNCGCCLNTTCGKGGYCAHGFQDGYWGNRCYHECPQRCLTCGRNPDKVKGIVIHECYKCAMGRFPGHSYDCSNVCPSNCKACFSVNDCIECEPRFYNSLTITNCSLSCPANCKECSSDENCTVCVPGYFEEESLCRRICPQNCKECITGSQCISCKIGHYNGRLEDDKSKTLYNDCRHHCRSTCTMCSSYNHCQGCMLGLYGSQCQFKCSNGCANNTCDIISGKCNCKTGFFGDYCSECVLGKFGTACTESCPENCYGNKCDKKSGYCTRCSSGDFMGVTCNQCTHNKYGVNCADNCSSACNQISGMRICDEKTGHCLFGCGDGYYGSTCNDTCSEFCIDDLCDQQLGTCLKGCRASGGTFKDLQCRIGEEDWSLIKVVAPPGASVVILIFGMIGCICFIKCSRERRQMVERNQQATYPNAVYFDAMDHQHIEMEQIDQCSGDPFDDHNYESLPLESVGESNDYLDYVNLTLTEF